MDAYLRSPTAWINKLMLNYSCIKPILQLSLGDGSHISTASWTFVSIAK